MLFAVFVEGKNDLYFFAEIIKAFKNYQKGEIVMDWKLGLLLNYFKTLKTTVLTKNGDTLVIIQCKGKTSAIRAFKHSLKEFLNNDAVRKSFLIIDADQSLDVKTQILDEILEQKTPGIENEKPIVFKRLLKTKLKKYPNTLETGIIDICPNLEIVISNFLKKFKVIPKEFTKESDPHDIIKNAIIVLKMENYEEFCKYLISKKNDELKEELDRLTILDSLCEIV